MRNPRRLQEARFNLAIEMLVISGNRKSPLQNCLVESFNLAIEMLVISGDGHS